MTKKLYLSFITQQEANEAKVSLISKEELQELVINPLTKNEMASISITDNYTKDKNYLYINLDTALELTKTFKKDNLFKSISAVSLNFSHDSYQSMVFFIKILKTLKGIDLESLTLELPEISRKKLFKVTPSSDPTFLRQLHNILVQIGTIKKLSIEGSRISAITTTHQTNSLQILHMKEDQDYIDLADFIKKNPSLTKLSNIVNDVGINEETSAMAQIELAEAIRSIAFKKISLNGFYYNSDDYPVSPTNAGQKKSDKNEIKQETYNSFPLYLFDHPTAEELYLGLCSLNSLDFKPTGLTNSKLKILYLFNSFDEDTADECLINLGKAIELNSTLEELDISYNKFTDKALFSFLESLKSSKACIKKLIFDHLYNISLRGYEAIAKFINQYSALEELIVFGNQPNKNMTFCAQILDYLAEALKTNKTLKILDLSEMFENFSETVDKRQINLAIENLASAIKLNLYSAITQVKCGGNLDSVVKEKLQEAIATASKNREKLYQLRTASLHDNSSKNVNSKTEKSEYLEDSEESAEKMSKTETPSM